MFKAFIKKLNDWLPQPVNHQNAFVPVVESNRELCLQLVEELEGVINNPYHPLAASGVFMTAPVPNITRYLSMLRQYNRSLREKKAIDPNDCNWTMRTLTLDQFFVSDDNYYIDASAILEVVQEARTLCEFMDGAESAEYGTEEHNNRMLMKFFVSLKSILAAFLQILAD